MYPILFYGYLQISLCVSYKAKNKISLPRFSLIEIDHAVFDAITKFFVRVSSGSKKKVSLKLHIILKV